MNQSEINVQSTALKEANRLMTICNSCRYCEGLCAVFPAMEKRSSFFEGASLNDIHCGSILFSR